MSEMTDVFPIPSPGWHYDEDTGALMRDVIHRMGRRCRNWDYCGKGVYQITITLADRKSRALGRLCHEAAKGAWVELSEVGREIEALMWRMAEFTPEIEVLGVRVMPDHIHWVLKVARRLYEKLAHPELFTVLRDLPVELGGFTGHFAAIGNHNLLKAQ